MSTILDNIIQHLEKTENLKEYMLKHNLSRAIQELQTWQTKRLLITHEKLMQEKRFKPAMQFFVDELYGPKDFSQRDQELAKVVPKMASVLPNKALVSLEAALKLNSLSLGLDIILIEHLGENKLDRDSYFEAYRQSNNREDREEQIRLLESLGEDLAQVVKITGISTILMMSRRPAKLAGVKSLHEFLEQGFKAFKRLGDVNDFIDPIVSKEREILQDLFLAKGLKDNPLPLV